MEKQEVQSLIQERDFYKRAYEELLSRLASGGISLNTPVVKESTENKPLLMHERLKSLTVKRLLLLTAYLLYGAKSAEIAHELGVSLNSVRVILFRTKENLGMNNNARRAQEVIEGLKQYDDQEFQQKTGVPKDWWNHKDEYRDQVRSVPDRVR